MLERNISVDQVKPVKVWLQKDERYVNQFINNDDKPEDDDNSDGENPVEPSDDEPADNPVNPEP